MTTEQTKKSKQEDSVAQGIHVVAKPIGPACNLNCEYCFYLEKQALFAPGEHFRMSDRLLSAFINNYITSQPTPVVEFVWQVDTPNSPLWAVYQINDDDSYTGLRRCFGCFAQTAPGEWSSDVVEYNDGRYMVCANVAGDLQTFRTWTFRIGGNGNKKPTGFLAGPTPVATADATRAFGTLQFFASGEAAALPSNPDVFIDMVYGVRARYRNNARWLTSKLVMAAMRKYKDSTGQYLWQPALTAGQPATFVNYGITEAEDMPAVAANSFPLAFGDFREGYLIADRVGMRMTRDEITQPGFVKFYLRKRVGGILRNTQAIKLLKIAG
jgi:hypothetical protein